MSDLRERRLRSVVVLQDVNERLAAVVNELASIVVDIIELKAVLRSAEEENEKAG